MADETDPTFFNNQHYRERSAGEDPKTKYEIDWSEGFQATVNMPAVNYNLIDGSQALANKGQVLSFRHVPSGKEVYFKAFISAFNETYSPEWAAESVFGRADPIYMFKQTTRKITLAFKIPCSTESEGYENLAKVQRLVQFLYPTYENVDSATTITQSPLIRLKVMNLVTNVSWGDRGSGTDLLDKYTSTTDANYGLLGAVNNLTVNHNLENPEAGVLELHADAGTILPKLIEVNLDFSAIHEKPLGWEGSSFRSSYFPYGAPLEDTTAEEDEQALYGMTTLAAGGDTEFNYPDLDREPSSSIAVKAPTNQNDDGWTVIPGNVEDEGEAVPYTSDQDAANAEARYAGALGNMRLNRDLRQAGKGKTNEYVDSAIQGAYDSGKFGVRSEGATLRSDDYDYVVSSRTEKFYDV